MGLFTKWWTWVVFFFFLSNAACFQPMALPKEAQEIARAVAVSMTDQAVWERIEASTDGHVINPGIRVEAGVMYVATGRLEGVDADMRLGGAGRGTGVQSEAAQAVIRQILSDGSVQDPAFRAQLEALLKLLARDDAGGPVVPEQRLPFSSARPCRWAQST